MTHSGMCFWWLQLSGDSRCISIREKASFFSCSSLSFIPSFHPQLTVFGKLEWIRRQDVPSPVSVLVSSVHPPPPPAAPPLPLQQQPPPSPNHKHLSTLAWQISFGLILWMQLALLLMLMVLHALHLRRHRHKHLYARFEKQRDKGNLYSSLHVSLVSSSS